MEQSLGKLWKNKIISTHKALVATTLEVLRKEVESRINASSQEIIKQTLSNSLLNIHLGKDLLCEPIAIWLGDNDLAYKLVKENDKVIIWISFDKDILEKINANESST